jgi:AcrR family transcriptional regulator
MTTRRPHDAAASRQALLDAASALFHERGYERTTVRDIGERAAVDPALIARYFGGKEGLYLATLNPEHRPPLPSDPAKVIPAILARSATHGIGPVSRAVVNPGLTDELRDEVRRILDARVVTPLAEELPESEDARLRAELVVALAIGLSLARAGGTLPKLQKTSLAKLERVLEPVIAELTSPGRGPSSSASSATSRTRRRAPARPARDGA